MTTTGSPAPTLATTGPSSHRHTAPGADVRRAHLALVRLWTRLTRRGTLLLAVSVAAYVGLEVASYSMAYPNGVSPTQFALFTENPAVRMMQGVPTALGSPGGFALWDAGWMVQLVLAVWAVLVASRLLRGEEDLERTDLVLAGPVRPAFATGSAIVVLCACGAVVGLGVTAVLALKGTGVVAPILAGCALTGLAATFTAATAVVAQLLTVRRRVAAAAAGLIGLAYVVRMTANSSDDRSWLRWLSPLAWLDQLDPYGAHDLRILMPLVLVPLALGVVAVVLRGRRDTGDAILAREDARDPRLRGLSSSVAFAWRQNRGALLAWTLGLGAVAVVMGMVVETGIDWMKQDEQYEQLLTRLGFADILSVRGFVSVIGSMLALAVALQVSWRIGAARAEEESGRLEMVLARPVSRARWIGDHALLALLGGLALLSILGLGVWLGARLSGDTSLTAGDGVRSALNGLPVIVLVEGLALLSLGVAPRLTVAVPATVAVVGYVLTMLSPALRWPGWVTDLSPWSHLTLVPLQDFATTAGIVMTVLGFGLALVGVLAFGRRDVVGA